MNIMEQFTNKTKYEKEDFISNLKVCRVCLATNVKIINSHHHKHLLDLLLKLSHINERQSKSLPPWLCLRCLSLLKKYIILKNICSKSFEILSDCLRYEITDVLDYLSKNRKREGVSLDLCWSDISIEYYIPNNNQNIVILESSIEENLTKDIKKQDEVLNEIEIENSVDVTKIKTEIHDDHFSESDDEPIIKKKCKNKMSKKITTPDRISPKYKSNLKKETSSSPAKNFDASMVTMKSLSVAEQMKELEDARTTEEYLKSPYKCEDCVKGFSHETVYNNHLMKHQSMSGPHICNLCHQRFSSLINLSNHNETHAMRYTCKVCNKILSTKQTIMSHLYTEHDQTNKQINCDVCHKTYKNRYSYKKHLKIHNKPKEHKCDKCPKVFLWKDNLIRHLTRHKSERPYVCTLCPRAFHLKENLKEHNLVHSEAKKYYCIECDLSYASQGKLNQHLKRGAKHLKPELLTFPCGMCDMRYTNNIQLSMHINHVHLNKRPHACQLCDKSFVSRTGMLSHVKIVHEGYQKPKDNICEACGKAFSAKHILAAHIRTHTGERPFICKQCGANFSQSGALYTHVKLVHLKVKRRHEPSLAANSKKSMTELENTKSEIGNENGP